jgi:hypothetical protein
MMISRHQNGWKNNNMKLPLQFRYLGTTVTNQNLFQEEIKRRLSWGNACYHSVQNLSSSPPLLSEKVKMKIYETILLPVVLYGHEILSMTVFKNRVLWTTFEPMRDGVTGDQRKFHNEEVRNLYSSPIMRIIRMIKTKRMRWTRHVALDPREDVVWAGVIWLRTSGGLL